MYSRIPTGIYLGYDKFFRSRLLILDAEKVAIEVERMEKEANAIKSEALKMCWYMRGGLSFGEAMHMSFKDRELIGMIIKENLETTKKSGLPFF